MDKLRRTFNARGMIALALVARAVGEAVWRVTGTGDTASGAPDVWRFIWDVTGSWWGLLIFFVIGFLWIAYLITTPNWVPKVLRWALVGDNKQQQANDAIDRRLKVVEVALDPIAKDQTRWENTERQLNNFRTEFDLYREVMRKHQFGPDDMWLNNLEESIESLSPVSTHPDDPSLDTSIRLAAIGRPVTEGFQFRVGARFKFSNGTKYRVRLTGIVAGPLFINAIEHRAIPVSLTPIQVEPNDAAETVLHVALPQQFASNIPVEGIHLLFEEMLAQVEAQNVGSTVWSQLGWNPMLGEGDVPK